MTFLLESTATSHASQCRFSPCGVRELRELRGKAAFHVL